MEIRLDLEPQLHAAREAREAIRSSLEGRFVGMFLHDLTLVVSELVSNSVQHGPGGPIRVRVVVDDDDLVRGEVEDHGDAVVAIREMTGSGGGLGLRIVDALTDRWAVYDGSTHVWFEMRPKSRGRPLRTDL